MRSVKPPAVYQLNVSLRDSNPLIWRRVQVLSSMTLPQLHRVLQVVMDWENYHLHQFRRGDKIYAEPDPENDSPGMGLVDERRVRISKVLPLIGDSCEYIYDFGDNWQHDILLETILPINPRKRYPCCVDGARSGPPEDSGGVWGYEEYLKALRDPKHPEHHAMLEWRGRFDPEYFPITGVNRSLKEQFPVLSPPIAANIGKPVRQKRSTPDTIEEELETLLAPLFRSAQLAQVKRIEIGPAEGIPVPFSARDRELITEHSFADTELTERLQVAPGSGKSQIFYFTFDELDDLLGYIAAEANHASKKARPEWDILHERMAAVLDGYSRKDQ